VYGVRAAELISQQEKQKMRVNLYERLYVVLGQVALGLSVASLILLMSNAKFMGNVLFQMLVDATNGPDATQQVRLQRQNALCSEWSQCVRGALRPTFCGNCLVPEITGRDPSLTIGFTQSHPFQGASASPIFTNMGIWGVAGFGACGTASTNAAPREATAVQLSEAVDCHTTTLTYVGWCSRTFCMACAQYW
jgi:hypothetical protein